MYHGTWYIKNEIKYFAGIEYCNNGFDKNKVLIKFNKNGICEYMSKMNFRNRKRKRKIEFLFNTYEL